MLDLDLALDSNVVTTMVCVPDDEAESEQVEESRSEKRKRRIGSCGKLWDTHVDPQTKRVIRGLYRCGYWRDCDACAEIRANKIKTDMIAAAMQSPLCYIECDNDIAEELCRSLGKDSYMRFPTDNGTSHMFYKESADIEIDITEDSQSLDIASLENLPWLSIVNLPPKRRSSGSLGRHQPHAKTESVKVEHFVSNAPQIVHDEAVSNAERDTRDQAPTTISEVESCLDEFTCLIKKYIIARGYDIQFSYYRTYRVDLKHLDWQRESQHDYD